jgi:serine/threonine-protein kinase HipA
VQAQPMIVAQGCSGGQSDFNALSLKRDTALYVLRKGHVLCKGPTLRPGDIGKLSLPGAQAKTAYYWDVAKNRWGVPGGRTPTTHIVKPCIPGFDGLVENEHLCQDIAARLDLMAARSSVLALDETYIVIERYDRLPPLAESPLPRRIHQEDLCQALSLLPARKYQEEGGPGIAQIAG